MYTLVMCDELELKCRLFLTKNSKHFMTLVGNNIYFWTYYWSLPPNFMEILWNFLWMIFPFTLLIVDDSKVPFLHCICVCVNSSYLVLHICLSCTCFFLHFHENYGPYLSSYIHTLELEWEVEKCAVKKNKERYWVVLRGMLSTVVERSTPTNLVYSAKFIRQKKEKQNKQKK